MISGVVMDQYLDIKTMFAKTIGIISSLGAGLFVGKVGPVLHTTTGFGYQLCKRIPYFKKVLENDQLRLQMFAASAGVGNSAGLGAPIGGVMFSVEVTATYFLVSTFWKTCLCAVSAMVLWFLTRGLCRQTFTEQESASRSTLSLVANENGQFALFSTSFGPVPYIFSDLCLFTLLGILMGLLGSFMVAYNRLLIHTRLTKPIVRKW